MRVDDRQRMIEAYRARMVPDAARKAALLHRLRASEQARVRGARRRTAVAIALSVAIAAALLLVIRGSTVMFANEEQRPAGDEALYGAETSGESEVVRERMATSRANARVGDARPAPVQPPPAIAEAEPAPIRRARSTPPAPSRPDPASIREEAELLAAAQAALRDAELSRVLGLLDQHARRFPDGVMQLEREALRVVALCRTDRRDDALPTARKLLADPRAGSYAARIAHACGLPR